MLQLDGMPSRFNESVAHRLRRYIHLRRHIPVFVAARTRKVRNLLPDVTASIPDIAHIARTNNKSFRLRRISAFLPPASCGVSSGGPL